jgi:hypothetical protein
MKARQLTYTERTARFPLDFDVQLGRNGKPEAKVPVAWETANLVRLGPYSAGEQLVFSPRLNINAAPVFSVLFETLKAAGLLGDIHTYDGGFVVRLKRGVELPKIGASKDAYGKLLSNHSRGTAIDLNAQWNQMGHPAAGKGTCGYLGRVLEVARAVRVNVETAGHAWPAGLVCGADWKGTSIDPMHIEVGTWEPA